MDDYQLENLMKAISLTEEEDTVTIVVDNLLSKKREEVACTLVGRVLTSKGVNKEGLRLAMRKAWGPQRGFLFAELGQTLFSFKFEKQGDLDYVLRKGPWNFEHSLVVIQKMDGSVPPSLMSFDYESFWVRFYNLPLLCRSREVGSLLGEKLGFTEDVDEGINGDCNGRSLRVRVRINIRLPLKRGVKIAFETNPQPVWIPVTYERLPDFCFECGCIGHGFKDCEKYASLPLESRQGRRPYGAWLRAQASFTRGGGE